MKLTELIDKRVDENVASYDLGTLESYKYLIEMIAIEYYNEQLRLYNVVKQSELLVCDKCDEDGWIVRNEGDIISRKLCNCDKAN